MRSRSCAFQARMNAIESGGAPSAPLVEECSNSVARRGAVVGIEGDAEDEPSLGIDAVREQHFDFGGGAGLTRRPHDALQGETIARPAMTWVQSRTRIPLRGPEGRGVSAMRSLLVGCKWVAVAGAVFAAPGRITLGVESC